MVALASGCTALLDLDAPRSDQDLDGVVDEADNCPANANAQQLDTDRDGAGNVCDCARLSGADADADGIDDACDDCVGTANGLDELGNGIDDGCEVCPEAGRDRDRDGVDDACDVCPAGPPHDEDGDGLHDACDNCPIRPNAGQEATGGGLGDACGLTSERSAFFDGFGFRDSLVWPTDDDAWQWQNDQLLVDPGGQRAALVERSGTMTFEVRVDATGSAGIRCGAGSPTSCWIEPGLIKLEWLSIVTRSADADLPPREGPWRLRMVVTPLSATCLAFDDEGREQARAEIDRGNSCSSVSLWSDAPAAFDYFYIARE